MSKRKNIAIGHLEHEVPPHLIKGSIVKSCAKCDATIYLSPNSKPFLPKIDQLVCTQCANGMPNFVLNDERNNPQGDLHSINIFEQARFAPIKVVWKKVAKHSLRALYHHKFCKCNMPCWLLHEVMANMYQRAAIARTINMN